MIGSMTLSWSCPASAAMVMVRSLPITWNATWFTTSGMTGLTFPGMIDEPGCIGGRLISTRPQRGPEASRRRSLHILESLTATRLSTPENITNAPVSGVASTRFSAQLKVEPGDPAELLDGELGVARVGVDAGADGGAAEVDLEEQPRGFAQARDVLGGGDGEGRELLARGSSVRRPGAGCGPS